MTKREVITREDVEQYYSQCRKIKFRDIEVSSIEQIIKETIFTTGENTTVYTRGGRHCGARRYRSLDDIIKLVKFYYPETKINTIFTKIIELEDTLKTKNRSLSFIYCPNIRKDNFHGENFYSFGFKDIITTRPSRTFKGQGFVNCNIRYSEFITT